MRNNAYLDQKINQIWFQYFPDISIINKIHIKFGPIAKKRLGSIRKKNIDRKTGEFDTLILINGHFRDPLIPDYIIEATIAHELCHYAHGFSSPLPQLYQSPHRGGVIDKEMADRDLQPLADKEDRWLQSNWLNYLESV